MVTLKGKSLFKSFRTRGLDFIFQIENDESLWELSHTQTLIRF